VFTAAHLERMQEIMRDVCADFKTELAEFNGQASHVHLLVNFPPTVAIPRLVNSLKGLSSRRLRQEFPELAPHCWRPNGYGPDRTSPDRPAARRSPSRNTTLSSKTADRAHGYVPPS
jgi:REP element-mobilizing transposase RayT